MALSVLQQLPGDSLSSESPGQAEGRAAAISGKKNEAAAREEAPWEWGTHILSRRCFVFLARDSF